MFLHLKSGALLPIKTGSMRVATQIRIGFYSLFLLLLAVGAAGLLQMNSVWRGTERMYNHPYTVRKAIDNIAFNTLYMQRGMSELFHTEVEEDKTAILQSIDSVEAESANQFALLQNRYLGPQDHLSGLKNDFVKWKTIREETIRLLRAGNTDEAHDRTRPLGCNSMQVNDLLAHLTIIDEFARGKGDQFYNEAKRHKNKLLLFLATLIVASGLVVIGVTRVLLSRIKVPLTELSRVSKALKEGDFTSRSEYKHHNEFGVVSDAFNEMAESVQNNILLTLQIADLNRVMAGVDDAQKFFSATVSALGEKTGSQLWAVYLLSDDKQRFEYFTSAGGSNGMRTSFSVATAEGEIGCAAARRTIQRVKNIPHDTNLLFPAAGGTFTPREIITIPIIAGQEVIAVISLASVADYTQAAINLIESLQGTLSARVEGILAYRKVKGLSDQLKVQNSELTAQKTELAAQSEELTAQNIELETQKQELADASKLKTTFLSNMSHELRTPLNSVIALSGVLNRRLSGKIPTEECSYIEVIERNGKLLLSLINDILDIARIESGREEVSPSRFDLGALVADIVELIEPQARQKHLTLTVDAVDTKIMIESDSDKCRHILMNIIGNAVKFTDNGSVTVAVRQNGDAVEIVVTDTGIGIGQEHLPYIFEEFRQADSGTARRYGGTGLGLSIAKKYAELLGGTIVVVSVPGKGSTFTVRLPSRLTEGGRVSGVQDSLPPHLWTSRDKWHTHPSHPRKGATLLLVDDSEPALVQLKDILLEQGYRLLIARGGADALAIIDKELPDAIILDLMMPGVDGFAVLKSVRDAERSAKIPVLILTAKHITKEDLSFLSRNNIHQLIQKGNVDPAQLCNAIAIMVPELLPVAPKVQTVVPLLQGAQKPVVLVIEDNPDNMITLRALLGNEFTVVEAHDGHAGVSTALRLVPDLILIDIGLPGKDGVAAFKQIRSCSETKTIPVIVVTARAMKDDRFAIMEHGFDGYITKPIDAAELHECICGVLYGK